MPTLALLVFISTARGAVAAPCQAVTGDASVVDEVAGMVQVCGSLFAVEELRLGMYRGLMAHRRGSSCRRGSSVAWQGAENATVTAAHIPPCLAPCTPPQRMVAPVAGAGFCVADRGHAVEWKGLRLRFQRDAEDIKLATRDLIDTCFRWARHSRPSRQALPWCRGGGL